MIAADSSLEIGVWAGRFIDPETEALSRLGATYRDLQQMRLAADQRMLGDAFAERFADLERYVGRQLVKATRRHPLWPWLSNYPGLGGVYTAILIGAIGDPRRFPGQKCTVGHHLPPLYEPGEPCPLGPAERPTESDGPHGGAKGLHVIERGGADHADVSERPAGPASCPGIMLPPRPGTGVRAVWHYCGLHVGEDGRSPRKRKGQRATWNPQARTAVLQPGGIAEQIVRLRVAPYRGIYDEAKARLTRERGAERRREIEIESGSAQNGEEADGGREIETVLGLLRPFQIEAIARKIAAKAFVGDLLVAWKGISS